MVFYACFISFRLQAFHPFPYNHWPCSVCCILLITSDEQTNNSRDLNCEYMWKKKMLVCVIIFPCDTKMSKLTAIHLGAGVYTGFIRTASYLPCVLLFFFAFANVTFWLALLWWFVWPSFPWNCVYSWIRGDLVTFYQLFCQYLDGRKIAGIFFCV